MDLHGLSVFFRENNKNLHHNVELMLAYYTKFKITNKNLRDLRENFFMEQCKKKLDDPQSNWDVDQMEPLEKYKNEWDAYDKIQKREITLFKSRLEDINKEYKNMKIVHRQQLKVCFHIKNKIEELVESKTAYENVINLLMKEKETIDLYNPGNSPTKKIPFNKSNFIKFTIRNTCWLCKRGFKRA
jgi:hypothetical protein